MQITDHVLLDRRLLILIIIILDSIGSVATSIGVLLYRLSFVFSLRSQQAARYYGKICDIVFLVMQTSNIFCAVTLTLSVSLST